MSNDNDKYYHSVAKTLFTVAHVPTFTTWRSFVEGFDRGQLKGGHRTHFSCPYCIPTLNSLPVFDSTRKKFILFNLSYALVFRGALGPQPKGLLILHYVTSNARSLAAKVNADRAEQGKASFAFALNLDPSPTEPRDSPTRIPYPGALVTSAAVSRLKLSDHRPAQPLPRL
jgi:hypothetical protein